MEDRYVEDYNRGVNAIRQHKRKNTTYVPGAGMCMSLDSQEQVRMFFEKHTRNGDPVYMIGVTNNRGDFNEHTQRAYVSLRMEAREATLGRWADPEGTVYNDIIVVMSGISREQALKYKKQYMQLSIVVIDRDGHAELV